MSTLIPRSTRAIVLAAGSGSRLSPLTRALYGIELPKQFAALCGTRSLLQDTMDRIGSLVPPERTAVVVSEACADIARAQLDEYAGVEIVEQPANAGTGPGVLLPLVHVRAADPGADVLVFPSDHHVRRPDLFREAARTALTAARSAPAGVALVGACPDRAAGDLGWIVPRGVAADGTLLVGRFVEKPGPDTAQALLSGGALWNTFVLAGSVEAMWALARRHLPRQAAELERYSGHLGSAEAGRILKGIYRDLTPADFSRDVLEEADGLAVAPAMLCGWSDCGTPDRLFESLEGTPELGYLRSRIRACTSPRRRPQDRIRAAVVGA